MLVMRKSRMLLVLHGLEVLQALLK